MQDSFAFMMSPAWWLSAVGFGIAVNLVSAYLKPHLDQALSKYSAARRERLENERHKSHLRRERLRSDQHAQLITALHSVWLLLLASLTAAVALVIASIGSVQAITNPGGGLHAWPTKALLAMLAFVVFSLARGGYTGMSDVLLALPLSSPFFKH